MFHVILMLALVVGDGQAYRYFFTSLNVAKSHLAYNGKWADILVQNGHQVDFLLRKNNDFVPGHGTTLANVTVHHPNNMDKIDEAAKSLPMYHDVFTEPGDVFAWPFLDGLQQLLDLECEAILTNRTLISHFQSQKYDAIVIEHIDKCGYYLAEVIDRTAPIMLSSAQGLGFPARNLLNIPSPPGLVQVYNEVNAALSMSFVERALNLWNYVRYHYIIPYKTYDNRFLVEKGVLPDDFPDLQTIAQRVTYVFLNSVDFMNFPDYSTSQVKHVFSIPHSMVTNTPDDILKPILDKARKGVVLFSFGTIVDSRTMKAHQRRMFLDAFTRFPDYEFVWQVQDSESAEVGRLFEPIPRNVHLASWINQPALLAHPKTALMISHGGLNGMMETAMNAVPLLSIPMFMDHKRSARIAQYYGFALVLDKYTLSEHAIAQSLAEVLNNDKYKKCALAVQSMFRDSAENAERTFLEAAEFTASHGSMLFKLNIPPLTTTHLYCLDVIFVVILLVMVVTYRVLGLISGFKPISKAFPFAELSEKKCQ